MLPRQAVRELCIAAAVFLTIWSGIPEALVRASWLPLRQNRLFVALCLTAVGLLCHVWLTPAYEPARPDERSDERVA